MMQLTGDCQVGKYSPGPAGVRAGPVILVRGVEIEGMCPATAREEKPGPVFRHGGFQCAVLAIAFDVHDQVVTGIETP